MTMRPQKRTGINLSILLLSVTTWTMLLVNPRGIMTIAHCPVTDSETSLASLQMLLAMNPVSSLIAGWTLMLVAMMLPTLIAPIGHVAERSFKHRRVRSTLLFVVGYAAIWLTAGSVLLSVRLGLSWLAPHSFAPVIVAGIVAFVWQCSPMKQRCLNRNHNHRELAAFGLTADLDALRFGMTHGIWCAGSCWALMLLPMLLSEGHFPAMAIVTFLMISERLEQPRQLSWGLRLRGKLLRIVVAQARIRLDGLLSRSRSFSPTT